MTRRLSEVLTWIPLPDQICRPVTQDGGFSEQSIKRGLIPAGRRVYDP